MSSAAEQLAKLHRPSVFEYLDYRDFLNDWLEYLGQTKVSFSTRSLCLRCGLSPSLLYLVTSKSRPLTADAFEKLLPYLELSSSEGNFLRLLRELCEASDIQKKMECYSRISRFSEYKEKASTDIKNYKYISAWYHVVIREMARIDGFKADPKWIRKRLKNKISSKEIAKALDFLLEGGFIEKHADGKVSATESLIKCERDIMKLALTQSHEQTLDLATKSIYNTESAQRRLVTHTAAIPQDQFNEVNDVISEALKKIEAITKKATKSDTVYQVSFLSFPLTKAEGVEE